MRQRKKAVQNNNKYNNKRNKLLNKRLNKPNKISKKMLKTIYMNKKFLPHK